MRKPLSGRIFFLSALALLLGSISASCDIGDSSKEKFFCAKKFYVQNLSSDYKLTFLGERIGAKGAKAFEIPVHWQTRCAGDEEELMFTKPLEGLKGKMKLRLGMSRSEDMVLSYWKTEAAGKVERVEVEVNFTVSSKHDGDRWLVTFKER